ncbi:hypothetical protein A5687_15695 [Mycobacterium mantenii]|uniref:DUF7159 domain-containing protein n=1 Tax=Mycobacterium mantenii TaxID=560555 RepID=A0A1A2TCC8_MYCNT|nr:hypothetical protein A5688_07320 [Mycobacterium mantenii]OBH48225.1 hypothetical protein A5687_15695 [Mycobacterium mantenii]OBH73702.1 hypothetical protein A5683_24670 [Mycobacterium mantenii]
MSMAPTAVRMVLVEGENGDGATVDEDNFDVAAAADAATVTASDQVVSAILGTRQGAAEGGYQLASTGVTFTDPLEAAALRDKLAAHKVENVMLVSAFLAAAALAQAVGHQTNYAQTALLYIEPDTATLAVVDSADGSITDVRRQVLPEDDEAAVAELTRLVSGAENMESRPDAVFVVGSGIDIPLIKPALEAATTLPLTAPEEPDTALARGAALASAHAPLFSSSTAALAYAQDPGTGAINPLAVAPGYFETPGEAGADGLAYSAVPDDPDEFFTGSYAPTDLVNADYPERRSFKLVGSAVAGIFVIGVVALVVSLAIAIRPTANVQPSPNQNVVVAPTRPAPAPAAPAPEQAPAPAAPAPAPAAPAPEAPAPEQAPAPAAVPAPAPAPAPAAPAPIPVPEAPAPAAPPPPPPAVAPIPVPIPLPIPGLGGPGFGGPPGGGHGGGDDGPRGGGGFPGIPGFGGGHGGFGGGHGGFGRH